MSSQVPHPPAWQTFLRQNWLLLVGLIVLILFPHLVGWLTGDSPFGQLRGERYRMVGQSIFWQSVLIEVFALSILVMSYNLMFGFTGVISFGHAMFFGLGGYIVGIIAEVMQPDPTVGLLVGVAVTLAVSAVLGLAIGLASLRLRGVYFAIFTLAVAEMVWIYFGRLELTNGEDGLTIANIPEWIDPSRSRLSFYYIALALFVFAFIFIRRLVNSPTGTVFKAIRDNEERAQAIGYHTLRYKLMAITIAGMMAGLAGIIHAILQKSARPEFLSVTYTVDALLMTIIGGVGTFIGPVVGATGLHLANTFFRDLEVTLGSGVLDIGDSWNLLLGVVFIVVVLIFPYGIIGTLQRWRTGAGIIRRKNSGQPPQTP